MPQFTVYVPENWEYLNLLKSQIGEYPKSFRSLSELGKVALADYLQRHRPGVLKIVDSVSVNHGPETFVDAKRLREILVVQPLESEQLFAVGVLDAQNKAVLFREGNMSLYSSGGGWAALVDFHRWLRRRELLEKTKLVYAPKEAYGEIEALGIFDPACLVQAEVDLPKREFKKWLLQTGGKRVAISNASYQADLAITHCFRTPISDGERYLLETILRSEQDAALPQHSNREYVEVGSVQNLCYKSHIAPPTVDETVVLVFDWQGRFVDFERKSR